MLKASFSTAFAYAMADTLLLMSSSGSCLTVEAFEKDSGE
jgi:hypothetical protein